MVLTKSKLLAILEDEALRRRAMARISPELAQHHLETARALELARKMIKRKDERHENIRNYKHERRRWKNRNHYSAGQHPGE